MKVLEVIQDLKNTYKSGKLQEAKQLVMEFPLKYGESELEIIKGSLYLYYIVKVLLVVLD